jgi:hypothetical protein
LDIQAHKTTNTGEQETHILLIPVNYVNVDEWCTILWVSHNYYKMAEYMYTYYVHVTPLTQKSLRKLALVVTLLYLGGPQFESQTKHGLSCVRFSSLFLNPPAQMPGEYCKLSQPSSST